MITGTASGIGLACAERFLTAGYIVYGADKSPAPMELSQESDYRHFQADLSSYATAQEWAALVNIEAGDRIDALINCAGWHPPDRTIDEATTESFSDLLSANLLSAFNTSKATIAELRRSHGAIVNMSSLVGEIGQEAALEYCATKGAITAMTKALAIDEGRHGVRVNCIAPGAILTPLATAVNTPEQLNVVGKWAWLGRLGTAAEVADAAFFLATAGGFITGAELIISGGAELGYAAKSN